MTARPALSARHRSIEDALAALGAFDMHARSEAG